MKSSAISNLIRKHLPTIIDAIEHAEETGLDKPGSAKLELAVDYLNGLVDIPLLPEAIERTIFKAAITAVVELAKKAWGDQTWFQPLMELVR